MIGWAYSLASHYAQLSMKYALSTLWGGGGGEGEAMTPDQTLRGGNCSSKQTLATEIMQHLLSHKNVLGEIF